MTINPLRTELREAIKNYKKPNMGIFSLIASVIVFASTIANEFSTVDSIPIPHRADGFIYKNIYSVDSVIIEAFFDPLCPDSRDAWWPLKEILDSYGSQVSFVFHPFALPYHNNAFIACRSLHIANQINMSYTYPLLEHLFKHQQRFYNRNTFHISPANVTNKIIDLALEKLGNSWSSEFQSAYKNTVTDMATRISFKYGCSRAVTGTPYFFVNGIPLLEYGDEILDFIEWKRIIDPLLAGKRADS